MYLQRTRVFSWKLIVENPHRATLKRPEGPGTVKTWGAVTGSILREGENGTRCQGSSGGRRLGRGVGDKRVCVGENRRIQSDGCPLVTRPGWKGKWGRRSVSTPLCQQRRDNRLTMRTRLLEIKVHEDKDLRCIEFSVARVGVPTEDRPESGRIVGLGKR